jgi:hypothetical protein
VSKLMLARFQGHELLENIGGPAKGGNARRLTARRKQIINASHRGASLAPPTPWRRDNRCSK